ncbi:MAG: VOC family protein [Candidatus Binataceae bacterium]
MIQIGNHVKMTVARGLRSRTRAFYADLLQLKPLASPGDDLDLYEFADGFVVGLFFEDTAEVLAETDCLKAVWLELKVDDPKAWRTRLENFGVREVAYPDPARFYFQAPGGQVFRLAPLDGGL